MNWKLYDEQYNAWGEVVVKQRLEEHAQKVASPTESGHVKIDNSTIVTDANGRIKVADAISNKSKNVFFNIGTNIQQGRIEEAFFPTPFDCKINKINVKLVNESTNQIVFNLQKTTDFTTYEDVFQTPLVISPNSHNDTYDILSDVYLTSNECLFINVIQSSNDASNMVMDITIEKQ